MLKRTYELTISFIQYVKSHQILVDSDKRIFGILYTLMGWFLIAFSMVRFQPDYERMPLSFSMLIGFSSGLVFLYFLAKIFKIPLQIKPATDLDQRSHFSISSRKWLIYLRGAIAVLSYAGLMGAKRSLGVIDDSAIFGADALVYALLMWWIIKEKRTILEWMGILIGTLGVALPFIVNTPSFGLYVSITGGLLGVLSSTFMAIIFFMNSALVRHEPPARVAFYQCLMGLALAIILCLIKYRTLLNIIPQIKRADLTDSIVGGLLFAVALIFFFRAFLYTEVILIAITGYSLDPITICMIKMMGLGDSCISQNWLTIVLITIGTAILYYEEHHHGKLRRDVKANHPIYDQTVVEEFDQTDRKYKAHEISTGTYLLKKKQFYDLLFKISEDMVDNDIESIEVDKGIVYFSLFDPAITLECNESSMRSVPLEILSFNGYCKSELNMLYKLSKDLSVIVDFNAQVGWLTLNMAKKRPQAQLFAFEPEPECFSHLIRNIKNNQCDHVQALQCRLSDHNGLEKMALLPDDRILIPGEKALIYTDLKKFDCKSVTLEQALEGKNVEVVDLIMGQATGNELEMLKGASAILKNKTPILFLELFEEFCSEFDASIQDIIDYLKEYGYLPYQVVSEGNAEDQEASDSIPHYFFMHSKKHADKITQFKEELKTPEN